MSLADQIALLPADADVPPAIAAQWSRFHVGSMRYKVTLTREIATEKGKEPEHETATFTVTAEPDGPFGIRHKAHELAGSFNQGDWKADWTSLGPTPASWRAVADRHEREIGDVATALAKRSKS